MERRGEEEKDVRRGYEGLKREMRGGKLEEGCGISIRT